MPNGHDEPRLFRRYDQGTRDERNDRFASALSRYLDKKYPGPTPTGPDLGTGTLVASMLNPIFGAPIKIAMDEIFSSLLGQPSPIASQATPGTIDVTDPSVDPGDAEMSPLLKFLRAIRTVGRAAGVGLSRGAAIAPGAGLNLAYQEGELAPPQNEKEAMLHTLGAMLAGTVPFVGAGVLATPARTLAAPTLAKGTGQAAGLDFSAARIAEGFRETVPGFTRGLATDAAIGVGFGAAEATVSGGLERAIDPTAEGPNVAKEAALFGTFGLGLGAIFRIPTHANTARFFRSAFKGTPGPIDIAPDIIHGGLRSELVNGKVRFRNVESGQYVKAENVSRENIDAFRQLSVTRARELVEQTPQGAVAAQRATTATPENPSTLPPDLATPENIAQMNLYGGMYYNRAEGMVRRLGREKVSRQLEELRKLMVSDEPEHIRLSVGGRVLALERALGEAHRPPGQLPVELEASAIEAVARLTPYGRNEVLRAATDAALEGRKAFAQRMRELAPGSPGADLPATYAAEIQRRLAKANNARRQGTAEGTKGIFQGRPVELLQKPNMGLAWARRLDEASPDPVLVDVSEMAAFPRAGQSVMFKDGSVATVKIVDPAKGQVMVERPLRFNEGGQAPTEQGATEAWIPITEVQEIADSPSSFRSIEARQQSILNELHEGDIQPVSAIPAVTAEGEALTVTGIGSEAAEVTTKSGRKKTVRRNQLRASQADPNTRDIADFAPGKVPAEGNRILFFRVAGEQNSDFQRAWKNGDSLAGHVLDSRINRYGKTVLQPHVLPQPNSGDDVLYALELPADALARKDYSAGANNAVKALTGKGTVRDYGSWVDVPEDIFAQGQISEVSEALRGSTVRPTELLGQMTPEDQTAYLRHLLVFNEHIPSELAQPIAASKIARTQIVEAAARGDGAGVVEGESKLIDSHVDAANALETVKDNEARPQINQIVDETRATDPGAQAREQFELQGLTPETEAYYYQQLDGLPSANVGDPAKDALIAPSLNNSGQRAIISKYEHPAIQETPAGAKPTGQAYYEIEVVDPEGLTLRGATQQFESPVEVAAYLKTEGYEPTLYKTFAGEYENAANRSLTATVNPIKKGAPGTARMVVRERVVPENATRNVAEPPLELTAAQESILMELREGNRDAVAAAPMWRVVAQKEFKSAADVEAWLAGHQFTRRAPKSLDLTGRFKRLPSMERLSAIASGEMAVEGRVLTATRTKTPMTPAQTEARQALLKTINADVKAKIISKEEGALRLVEWERRNVGTTVEHTQSAQRAEAVDYLQATERQVKGVIQDYIQAEARLPAAVQAYAQDFSQLYYKVVGKPAFNKNIRSKSLWMPHIEDYGPSESRSVFAGQEGGAQEIVDGVIEDAYSAEGYREGWSRDIPEDVKVAANVRIGKNMNEQAAAADKLAGLIGSRTGHGLTQTQAWLVGELNKVAETLRTSKSMPAVEAAGVKLQELRRSAVAFEKLRLGISPTMLANIGTRSEEELVQLATKALKRRGAKLESAPEPVDRARRRLSEMDLLPANEEVMRALARLGENRAIMQGPHGQEFRTTLPKDFESGGHVFYQHVLGISTKSKSDILESAARVAKARKQQTLWADAAAKTEKVIPEPSVFSPRTDINLGVYKGTGQLVEIMDGPVELLTGTEARVRFMDGQEMTVAKDQISLQPYKKGEYAQDYRMVEYVLDGRYAALYKRDPPLGLGSLERELGVFGTKNRSVVAGALFEKTQDLLQGVRPAFGPVQSPVASKATWDKLFDIYRRARVLDELVTPEGKVSTLREEFALTQERSTRKFTGIPGTTVETLAEPSSPQAANALRGEGEYFTVHRERILGETEGLKAKQGRLAYPATQNMGEVVLAAVRDLDPKLEKPFKWSAYNRYRQVLGDDPFAEVQAQAMAGYLDPKQEAVLRGFASEVGLPSNTPLAKIVVELRERQMLDPQAALYAIQTRKQAAIIKWSEEVAGGNAMYSGIPLGGLGGKRQMPEVIIKSFASANDLKFGGIFGSSWRVANKHPFTRHVMDVIYRAQENEKRAIIKRSREFMMGLEQVGIKNKERNAIRELILEAHEKGWKGWDDIAANSDLVKNLSPEDRALYNHGYFAFRRAFSERKQDVVRHFMRRKVKPVIYDPNNLEHVAFAHALSKEYGVPISALREGSALLPFQPELIYNNARFADMGMAPRGYTEDEISFFIRLQEQFGSAAELPAQAPPGVRPEIYAEFGEVFDFWQRYGHDNYWPLVHEGSIGAIDAQGKIIAWGQSVPDVVEHLRTLVKDGRLDPEGEAVTIKQVGIIADDIMQQATTSRKEFRQLAGFYAEQIHMNPDEVMAMLVRQDRPTMTMNRPGQVHGKPRKAGLRPVTLDADREFALYNARIARMGYRWDVLNAFKAFQDVQLDRALSDAHGVPRVHESMPALKDYMTDVFRTAVGERRGAEKFADVWWMILNWMRQAPRELPAVLRGELDIMDVINPGTYYQKYAARSRASDLLGLQTLVKLGFSQGSAFANWTQFFITTVPKLIEKGETWDHVARLVWQGQRDGFKIFRAQYPIFGKPTKPTGELGLLVDMLDEAGIDLLPAKQMAGGRSVGDILGGQPIRGQSKTEFAYDWLNYGALYTFNGAEKINRFGTATVAIRRYADRLGKTLEQLTSTERGEAVESARRLVRETQFLYDELSLPRALRSGPLAGPLGRILFQFKPFMLNMLEYEASLVKNAFFKSETRFGKVALGQLAAHFGAMGVFGGAVGLAASPFLSLPYQLVNRLTGGNLIDPSTQLTAKQRERRRQMMSPEEQYSQSDHFKADDLLYYGLPGLVGLDMGQRVGVSGQDLMMTIGDIPGWLGPHASAYYDVFQAWKTYGQSRGRERATAGGLAGAVALNTFLPAGIRNKLPWTATYGGLLGASLGSSGAPNDFREFLRTSEEGKRAMNRLLPTAFKNATRTYELFAHGAMRDIDGKPMYVPADDRFGEEMALALGLPTIRRQEYMAAISMMTGQQAEKDVTQHIMTNRAADAWADGDYAKFYQIMYDAGKLDIDISEQSIQRRLEALTQERLTSTFNQLSPTIRAK